MSKNFIKGILLASLAFTLTLLPGCSSAPKGPQVLTTVKADGVDMLKYGHLDLDTPTNDLLAVFEHGDIVKVDLGKYGSFTVPVCPNYDDVAPGEKLIRAKPGKAETILAINYGKISTDLNIIEASKEGEKYPFTVKSDVEFPINVRITLVNKGGYAANLKMGKLNRTTDRSHYPSLNDAQFANFREITTTGIAPKTLYRSSSPINPEIGRNLFADKECEKAGIKTFVNLADSTEIAKDYPDFASSYYSKQNIVFLNLPVALSSDTFAKGLAEGMRFIIKNEGPYLVHCTEGKDRAGFTAAVLECLMGASFEEVQSDYYTTYVNYYDVADGSQKPLGKDVETMIKSIIQRNLNLVFEAKDLSKANLAKESENYLKKCGLTQDEVNALKARLAK